MNVHAKSVLVLALSCTSKQLTTLNNEFRYESKGTETLLDGLLTFCACHQVRTMSDAAQKTSEMNRV